MGDIKNWNWKHAVYITQWGGFTTVLYLINFNSLSYTAERLLKWTRLENIILHGKDTASSPGPAVLLCDCHEFFNFIKVSFSGYLFSRQFFRTHTWWSESTWTGSLKRKISGWWIFYMPKIITFSWLNVITQLILKWERSSLGFKKIFFSSIKI